MRRAEVEEDDCAYNMICAYGDDCFAKDTKNNAEPHARKFACVKCARCGVVFIYINNGFSCAATKSRKKSRGHGMGDLVVRGVILKCFYF